MTAPIKLEIQLHFPSLRSSKYSVFFRREGLCQKNYIVLHLKVS